jgi:dipeptidyl aminopeptidase/acylaminoacyl peptidase
MGIVRRLRSFVGAAVGLGACWVAPVAAQVSPGGPAVAPLAAEAFFKPDAIFDAKLSPSGRRLAVTTSGGGERVTLQVVELDEAMKPHGTARFTDVDVARFEWVNDDRLVFTTVNLAEGSGNQQRPGLLSVRFDGEEMRLLVAREGQPLLVRGTGAGPARTPPLAANHVLLHVPQQGDEVIVGALAGTRTELESVTPLRLNVVTGRTRPMLLQAPDRTVGWIFDHSGEARVAVTRKDGRRGVHWRAPGQEGWRLLDESSDVVAVPFSPLLVDSKGTLYVTQSEGRDGFRVLTRWDFAAGKPEANPLVRTPGFDFIGAPVVANDGTLWGFHITTDADSSVWFNDEMKLLQTMADARLPGYVNRVTRCRRCMGADKVVLVQARSDRDPGHLWLYRESEGGQPRWQLIGRHRPDIDPKRMATVAFDRIKARDGRDLPLWLTIPPGRKAGDGGPAVVLVHGGPWVRGGQWRWQPMEQFLASRGYVVVMPEFRGSTGYGFAHYEAGLAQWGRAMQNDVADAARWAIAQGWADRVCIAGGSYGGYSALMGLVNDGQLFRCGVAWAAVADLMLMLSGSWLTLDDVSDSARTHRMPVLIGDPQRDAEALQGVSPVVQAARIKRPLLLAYGGADLRVPLDHGTRLRKAMRDAGAEPEWVVYSDEAHSWMKLETRADFARRLETFLARHLK